MILFRVQFPTVMALELLCTELAVISGGEVGVDGLNVLPHVVHVPAPLATQLTNNTGTALINIPLAVGLQVVISVLPRTGQFCRLLVIGIRLYLCVERQGVDNHWKSRLMVCWPIYVCLGVRICKGILQ